MVLVLGSLYLGISKKYCSNELLSWNQCLSSSPAPALSSVISASPQKPCPRSRREEQLLECLKVAGALRAA